MSVLRDWIRRHKIAAFYLITFFISWGLGYSFVAVLRDGAYYLFIAAAVAVCGPALAAILVTRISGDGMMTDSSRKRWLLFLAAQVVCTAVFVMHNSLFNNSPLSAMMALFAFFLVVPPVTFIISAVYARNGSVRHMMASLNDFRGAGIWLVIALLFVPAMALFSMLIATALGLSDARPMGDYELGAPLVGLIVVKFLYQFFFFNGTGEEVGWSGFARPHLQARLSPLVTAVIVGLLWPPWHFFLWYAEGKAVFEAGYWLEAYLSQIPAVLIIGWLYNRSRGSMLVAGIAHAAANTAFAFLPNLNWDMFNAVSFSTAVLLILVDRMWQRLPADHPAVWHEQAKPPVTGKRPDTRQQLRNA